ncbi:unnamed protein product [Effrenium voratum]|nr:unnamed protein product [Effrenium voratum]
MHRPEASGSAGTGNWNRIWVLTLALLLQAGKKRNGLCHFESCLSNLMAQKTQQLWLCGSWRADGKLINQRRISLPAALVSLSQAVPPSKNPAELCQVGGWQALEGQSAVEALHRSDEWREQYQLVQKDGLALQSAPWSLRCDKELVAEACWANGLALQHAPELKDDWEVVMCAVSRNGTALMWASPELQADKEVVSRAVCESGGALAYASQELRADRDVVLAAVRQRGIALRYASEDLKADREVVKAAAGQSKRALMYAADVLKKDAAFIKEASSQAPAPAAERPAAPVPPSYGPGL